MLRRNLKYIFGFLLVSTIAYTANNSWPDLQVRPKPTASRPTGVEGDIFSDSTTHRLLYKDNNVWNNVLFPDSVDILTNKTFDANATGNSISNIENADIATAAAIARNKIANGTASHVLINDGSGALSSEVSLAGTRGGTGTSNAAILSYGSNNLTLTTSGITNVTLPTSGTLATLAGSETFTNKTLTTPIINAGNITFSGASNSVRLSLPSETTANLGGLNNVAGLLAYDTDQASVVFNNGSAWTTVGTGTGGGVIDYIAPYGNAELNNTTGWATYADAAGTSPVDGQGGSANVTFATNTSNPVIRGSYQYRFTKDAANRQGEGFSFDFNIDAGYVGKPMVCLLDYKIASGTYADNDMSFWIRDNDNTTIIQPSGYQVKNHTLSSDKIILEFPTASSSAHYKLIGHVASTSASAYALDFDNIQCGPNLKGAVSSVSDWIAYTPTLNSNTSVSINSAYWRRVGDSVEIQGRITYTGAGNNSVLTVTLPSGISIDSTKNSIDTSNNVTIIGTASWWDSGTDENYMKAVYLTSTSFEFFLDQTGGAFNSSLTANGDQVSYLITVPVVGWQSTTQMYDQIARTDISTRLYQSSAQTGINPNNTSVKITFDSTSYDTNGAFDNANDRVTIKIPGKYLIIGNIYLLGTNVLANFYASQIYKNGSNAQWGNSRWATAAGPDSFPAMTVLDLVAGDYIELFLYGAGNNSASTLSTNHTSAATTLSVVRMGDSGRQVGMAEKIYARYETTSGGTYNTASTTLIDFATKTFDDHNAVTTGGSWKFSPQRAGVAEVCAAVQIASMAGWGAGESASLQLFKNGSFYSYIGLNVMQAAHTTDVGLRGCDKISLIHGDYIDVRLGHNNGATAALIAAQAGSNYVTISME